MKQTLFLFVCIIVFAFKIKAEKVIYPKANNGKIDLRQWNFNTYPIIELNGNWNFYPYTFLHTDVSVQNKIIKQIKVPSSWNNIDADFGFNNGIGFGTYQLKIYKNPNRNLYLTVNQIQSACKIWVNSNLIYQAGKISKTNTNYFPQTKPQYIPINIQEDSINLVIEVANFSHTWGGIINAIKIGTKEQVVLAHERYLIAFFFLIGAIFMIGIYHLGLFFLKRTDFQSLNFGVFCFFIVIAYLFRSKTFYYYYADFNWEIGNKIEHIALFFTLPLFYTFFYLSFKTDFLKLFKVASIVIASLLSAITLFTPTLIFTKLTTTFHITLLVYAVAVFYSLTKTIYKNRRGGKIILTGFILFLIALVNDILHVQNIINTDNYILFGVFGFIVMQAMFLSQKSALATKKIEQLSDKLILINQSLKRFVPMEFLNMLKKEDITQVELGDHIDSNLTIMFSDIRSFTKISESLNANDSFNFINSYLKKMGPIIRNNNGFIDKYIGDCIMALFNKSADDAVKCALDMIAALQLFNQENRNQNVPKIKIGIGLHTGNCMLGTVGETERLDTTVISDAVNIASRIESLTKIYHTPILISEETFLALSNKKHLKIRFIGIVRVKGKSISIKLFEILTDNKLSAEDLIHFNQAINNYYLGNFMDAKKDLNYVNKAKHDKIFEFYLNKLNTISNNIANQDLNSLEIFTY